MIFGIDVVSMVLGGLAAGMVLFIVSVGLSVTMGLMGFVNLAHGGFAMLGGYVIVLTMRNWGLGFVPALALGFVVIAGVSIAFERLLYSRLYRATELDQVLFTIGLVFMMIASVTLIIGPENQQLMLPPWLQGQLDLGFMHYRTYSIFLIVVGTLIVIGLWLGFERTRMGAQIRAAVDNRRMAESLGINIDRLFMLTFAFGSGMAAVGGGLGAEFLGLNPQYPLIYLVYFLIVVSVGGLGRITGVFFASLIIGMLDFALKKYLPQGGTLFIYRADDPAAAVAAAGPVRRQGGMSVPAHELRLSDHPAALALVDRHRLRVVGAAAVAAGARLLFRVPEPSRLRHRSPGHDPVRALARSRARLCRHRHARPRRLLRRRRLHRRHAGASRHLDRADHRPRRWPPASPR